MYISLKILEKYKDKEHPLPIISQQKTNDYLKELCKLVEIDEIQKKVKYSGTKRIEIEKSKYDFISTHTARRTFVTLILIFYLSKINTLSYISVSILSYICSTDILC